MAAALAVTASLTTVADGRPAAGAAPVLTVEPATGLADGDLVTITVTGLTPDSWVDVAQCAAAPIDIVEDCDLGDAAYAMAAEDGTAETTMRVDAVITTGYPYGEPGREVDCRVEGCVVGVSVEGGTNMMAPLSFVPDAPLAPAPAVTVTPDTGLADLQAVTVEASGFVWSTRAMVLQCTADPANLEDCDLSGWTEVETTESGAFTTEHVALAVMETASDGAVDCRVDGACVVAVSSDQLRSASKTALVRLTFDPDAEVASPEVTVSPGADLVDGQSITVTGSGFPPGPGDEGSWVEIYECTDHPSYDNCESIGWAEIGAEGGFTTEARAWAILGTRSGEVDCRTAPGTCQVVATPGSPASPRAGTVALAFDPDGPLLPPPAIEVTPSRDLADGAEVTVSGTGFTPDFFAWVQVCQAGGMMSACDPAIEGFTETSASGTFTLDLTVNAAFEPWVGNAVDCLVDPGCEVAAEDFRRGRTATAEITFAAPVDEGRRYLDPVFDEVEVIEDLPYRDTVDAHGSPVHLALDLYQPAGDTAERRPVVVWSPGGWFGGEDDGVADAYARDFARRGYVVAVVDHRNRPDLGCCPTRDALGIAAAIADATDDGAAAVAWLRDHAADHRLDPRAIAAGGTEGGGAVSFGLAYPGQGRGQPHDGGGMHTMMTEDETTSVVAAAVPVSGVALGEPQEGAAPVLAFHGGADLRAPAHLSDWTCAAAHMVDARCDVVTYDGVGAGVGTAKRRDIVRRSVAFLAEVMLEPLGYLGEHDLPPTTIPTAERPAGERPSNAERGRARGDLPRTGADGTMTLVRVGVALALAGGMLVAAARRRRGRGAISDGQGG